MKYINLDIEDDDDALYDCELDDLIEMEDRLYVIIGFYNNGTPQLLEVSNPDKDKL